MTGKLKWIYYIYFRFFRAPVRFFRWIFAASNQLGRIFAVLWFIIAVDDLVYSQMSTKKQYLHQYLHVIKYANKEVRRKNPMTIIRLWSKSSKLLSQKDHSELRSLVTQSHWFLNQIRSLVCKYCSLVSIFWAWE